MFFRGEKLAARPIHIVRWQRAVPKRIRLFKKAGHHDKSDHWPVRIKALIFIGGAVGSWGLVALLFLN